ncbi:MAG TPA: SNF2-related protein [Saprospiraceae bacterium]|nr:SNF2-related protein [Saprospiraceae bacterium]
MTHQVVFNLYPFNETLYLPSANIVRVDDSGLLTHFEQRASIVTIPSYHIEMTPALTRLLGIVDLLSPKTLEAKYKPSKSKTALPLAQLLAGDDTRQVVEKFIFSNLDAFFSDLIRHKFPLTLDAERRTLAKDVQIVFPRETFVPHLFFKKTTAGVEYRLRLGTETATWNLREHNVLPLTNTDPAWLLIDYALFRVPGINGNMVKPFRQKDAVQIPPDKERIYFRQFIAKSIRRSRVEAEGFRVEKTDSLRSTRLETVENVLENRWFLRPVFEYDGAEFPFGDRRDRVTSLDIPEDEQGEIAVHLISRNEAAESARIALLEQLGLQAEGNTFAPADGKESSLAAILNFLTRHRPALEAAGFSIVAPQVDGKTLALAAHDISVRSEAAADWFDVQGRVTVGDYTFPFQKLLPNLRRHDPYFPLPDGAFFLIPDEWFARYADLADSVQEQGEHLRLPKALYTVLQESLPDTADASLPVIDPENIDYQPSGNLKATLRPYQLTGVKWLIGHYRHGFGACLADDMGLGKTLQTIALLLYAKDNPTPDPSPTGRGAVAYIATNSVTSSTEHSTSPLSVGEGLGVGSQLDLFQSYQQELRPLRALIILPASLVFNWQRELSVFAPSLFVYAHAGPKRLKDARALASHDVVLTTYHTARQDLALLEKTGWQFIILDESQQIKNRESEVSKVVRGLEGRHKISLSGTPIENSLADLWTQMEFINPDTLGSYKTFREQFQVPIEKQNDERAKARLFTRVQPFFLRRTKEEVAPDLPELTQQIFFSEMSDTQRKRYEQVKSAVRNEILSLFDDPKTRLMALQALTKLRQLANHPLLTDPEYTGASGKMDDVLAQWDVIRRAGHKVLFFSSFEQHLRIFRTYMEAARQPFAWLTGEVPPPERARAVERFQNDPSVQAFLMTLGAGGVGLNLTSADYVFLLDPWWNPAKEDQAIARAHRIGRVHPVTAIRFIARDTIEEKIVRLQEKKRRLGQDLFAAGAEFPALDKADVEMLLG